jgi:hypothetical protein
MTGIKFQKKKKKKKDKKNKGLKCKKNNKDKAMHWEGKGLENSTKPNAL